MGFIKNYARRAAAHAGERALDKYVFGAAFPRRSLRSAQPHERIDDLRPDVPLLGKLLWAGVPALTLLGAWILFDIAKSADPGWVVAMVIAMLTFHRSVFKWWLMARSVAYTDDVLFPTKRLFQGAIRMFGPARIAIIALALCAVLVLLTRLAGGTPFLAWLAGASFLAFLLSAVASAIMLGNWYTRDERDRYDLLWAYQVERIEDLPGDDENGLPDRVVRLSQTFTSQDLPNLQQYAESLGYTITDYDIVGRFRTAELSPVTPIEMAIYENAARNLGKPVYDFGMKFMWVENEEADSDVYPQRIESLTLERAPIGGLTPDKREAFLLAVRDSLRTADGWEIYDDQTNPVKVLKYGKPLKFEDIIPYDWDARPGYKGVPFAIDLKGEIVSLSLIESNMLLGGVPGGGKSGGLTALITGCARLENVALVGLDPKKVEQAMWRPRFSHIATELDDALATLYALADEMDARYDRLVEEGRKKVSADMISPEMPLIVVVADEMAELVAMGISKEEKGADQDRISKMQRLVQKGRAAGIVFIGATQKPAAEVIPTRLRDLVQQRVAYYTTNPFMTDTILGTGMSGNGGLAHEIVLSRTN